MKKLAYRAPNGKVSPFGGPIPVDPDGLPVVNFSATHYQVRVPCKACGGEGSTLIDDMAHPMGKWLECWDCNRGYVYEWRKG